METNLKIRVKTTAGAVTPGNTFRLIEQVKCYMVIDLTKNDMFTAPVPATPEVAILRTDVVYVLELMTGIVDIVPQSLVVYEIKLKADEVD